MMSGNELQYGLIGLGVIAIAGLVIYNLWQERKARKTAEHAFRSTHHDVLLEGDPEPVIPPAPGGRMEPGLREEPAIDNSAVLAARAATAHSRQQEPVLPRDLQAIDCAVTIEAPAGVSASSLFSTQLEALSGNSRHIAWYGWADLDNKWFPIDVRTPGSINRACVTLQLVDRRGAISDREVERFYDRLGRICDQFLAVPRLPEKSETLARARELDQFCADVDIQIAVSVLASQEPFDGMRLRGLAEAAGLTLGKDGCFHAIDEFGQRMFVLANQESAPFTPEQIRHLHTRGLSLVLDVPRVSAPSNAFDSMVDFARHLASSLGGEIVDDNRTPLSERSVSLIRNQIGQFEARMERQAIPAGSDIAQRLFA